MPETRKPLGRFVTSHGLDVLAAKYPAHANIFHCEPGRGLYTESILHVASVIGPYRKDEIKEPLSRLDEPQAWELA